MNKKVYSGIISTAITLLIAIAMILIIYATLSINNKSIFGYRFFIVTSGSMGSFIHAGEFIITKSEEIGSLKIGDVISFVSHEQDIYERINTHRIASVEKGYFITRGDANLQNDKTPVTPDRILGKVVFHSPILGFFVRALSKPLNMLLFIVLPITFMAVSDIRRARIKIKNALKESEKYGENEAVEPESATSDDTNTH